MSRETTYAGMLGDWRRLIESLATNSADLAHLEASRAKLEMLLAQGIELFNRQAGLRAAKQETSQELRQHMANGQRLVTVLRGAVREHYGITAEKLAEFGIQPFRGRRVKQEPEAPEEKSRSGVPPAAQADPSR